MNTCPGCNSNNWRELSDGLWQCGTCGYLLDAYAYGFKVDTGRPMSYSEKLLLAFGILVLIIAFLIPGGP